MSVPVDDHPMDFNSIPLQELLCNKLRTIMEEKTKELSVRSIVTNNSYCYVIIQYWMRGYPFSSIHSFDDIPLLPKNK
ncbi:hypothetical protein LINGRAHAP2_LOCUS26624 [Linum grandiflorum]